MRTHRWLGAFALVFTLAVPLAAHANPRIERFRIDPHGRVTGLILRDGTEYVVPSQLGAQLVSDFRVGDEVDIYGGPNNTLVFTDARTQRSLDLGHVDTLARGGGPTATAPVAVQYPRVDDARKLTQFTVRGRVGYITYTPNHVPTGFVMADGTQVHLVPGIEGVFAEVHPGDMFTVTGRGTRTTAGLSIWAITLAHPNGAIALDMMRGIGAPELNMGR